MATANWSPREMAYLNNIREASQKEAQNHELITELVKNILDLGGTVPVIEEPNIKENPRQGTLLGRLNYLQQKNQWLEKKIHEYIELIIKLNCSN
ncbi:MAG: hypothetical protein V4489_05325 [Chlamydiota bacterium]